MNIYISVHTAPVCNQALTSISARMLKFQTHSHTDTTVWTRENAAHTDTVTGMGGEALAAAVPYSGKVCLLYTSPSPRDRHRSRMPSSA